MAVSGIIFDLDQTLVDSEFLLESRERREWDTTYARIPEAVLYDGIPEVLRHVVSQQIATAVVTSTPRPYATKMLEHLCFHPLVTVCYHDTGRHKPDPAPIKLALDMLGVSPDSVWSIGDDAKDVIASRAATVTSVAAVWGSLDKTSLLGAAPDIIAYTPRDLLGKLVG